VTIEVGIVITLVMGAFVIGRLIGRDQIPKTLEQMEIDHKNKGRAEARAYWMDNHKGASEAEWLAELDRRMHSTDARQLTDEERATAARAAAARADSIARARATNEERARRPTVHYPPPTDEQRQAQRQRKAALRAAQAEAGPTLTVHYCPANEQHRSHVQSGIRVPGWYVFSQQADLVHLHGPFTSEQAAREFRPRPPHGPR
jgi:hypothetical protein